MIIIQSTFQILKIIFEAYDLGTSSNILEDPDDDDDSDALAFSAQVTSITGTGADSAIHGSIDISDKIIIVFPVVWLGLYFITLRIFSLV